MKISRTKSPYTSHRIKVFLLIFTVLALFSWRFISYLPRQQEGYVKLTSTLLEETQVYNQWQYFSLDVYNIKASSDLEINYGDRLEIEGEVKDGRFVDPKIKIVGSSTWRKVLFSIRNNLKTRIFTSLSEPQASLLAGVLLGAREELPDDFRESLRKTGTIHVVVVSGYNISVVAGLMVGLSRFFNRRLATILALAAIASYTLLVGADPPAVRAAIMGALGFSAIILGRQRFSLYALFLAAILMLFVSPIVATDIGFQLSFLATAGIILFQEKILTFSRVLPGPFNEDLATTISAQILVAPVIFYHFGSVSAISPLVNALVLWTIPFSTIGGFIFLVLSFTVPFLAAVAAWIVWALLSVFVFIVEVSSQLPITSFEFKPNQILPLLIYYLWLAAAIYYLRNVRLAYKKQTKS
ncbi:MAG: ComEC/Rec2 family competence protein [Candidatus Woykebacteria bacterium]